MEALEKGKAGYEMMAAPCRRLVESGNWQRVGTSDITLFLDMYVQALLLRMAQASGELSPELQAFTAGVPAKDILGIGKVSADAALNLGFKNRSFAEGTPLLLRCCIAMDDKDGGSTSRQFVEGATQLLYAAAEADGDMNGKELQFITTYAGGLRTFLMTRAAGRHVVQEQNWLPGADKVEKKGTKKEEKKSTETEEKKDAAVNPQGKSAAKATAEAKKEEPEKTLEELVAELDSLVGLTGVKEEVHTLINLIKVRKLREAHELKVMDMSFHMVFTGNPGTGKTTVARLVAKIYRKLGFLSQGQLIETDRSGLVAGYVGQTAGKVTEVVNSALGGILFIDEAYALARKGMENDFGKEAIDTLVKLMEDHRDDLVVIVAGYTKEMHDFLTSNPGLISRFNKYIDFPDYTDDELMAILAMNCKKQGYAPTEGAAREVRRMLESMSLADRMDFGNARGMRNVLEKLVSAQANRLAAVESEVTREQLMEITEEDVRTALKLEAEAAEAEQQEAVQAADAAESQAVDAAADTEQNPEERA